MANDELEFSSNVKQRNLKIMFWGDTGTRKTETVLRNFPHIFLIDTEGNSDQCIGMPEIPPFLRIKTKDTRKVVEWLDKIAAKQVKFPDGSLVETVAFDTVSLVWGIQQEVAAANAEKRAARYRKEESEATMTQLDWVLAKRPMKKIQNRINTIPVKYLVYIAREKDPYVGNDEAKLAVKPPVVPDCVKGTTYDMNLVLHFRKDGTKWSYEVDKVQGALGKLFPIGFKGPNLDIPGLLEYSKFLTGEGAKERDETDIAKEMAEETDAPQKTWAEMVKFANANGIATIDIAPILKEAGFRSFKTSEFDAIKSSIQAFLDRRIAVEIPEEAVA